MKIVNLVLGIGIFIIYLLTLNYGIMVFVGEPQYEDFCGETDIPVPVSVDRDDIKPVERQECFKEYDAAREVYAGKVFLISLIVGLLTLVIGYYVTKMEVLGGSLLASGIGAIVFGTLNNWMYLEDIWRFLLLLLALALLIYFTYRYNTRKEWWRIGQK